MHLLLYEEQDVFAMRILMGVFCFLAVTSEGLMFVSVWLLSTKASYPSLGVYIDKAAANRQIVNYELDALREMVENLKSTIGEEKINKACRSIYGVAH